LVLAAGVAQADVSFSGTAGVALIDDNGASDATRADMFFESYYDFDITASAESDNGVLYLLASTWALVTKSTIMMTMCLKHKATASVTQT
jgi:hypothetical protein